MAKSFWDRKTVFVTGSDGFTGSHLVSYLEIHHARVIGFTKSHPKRTHDIHLDVTKKKQLDEMFKKYQPFACFHLAAVSTVEAGTAHPYETFEQNIRSALNVLELGRLYGTKRVIVASTAHVYGDNEGAFHEEDTPRPSRPYETSKTTIDLIAQSYADTFHLPVLIPRFVNLYGPGDRNVGRVIPKTICAVLTGASPTMWGGKAAREYLYIDDAIAAYDLLGKLSDDKVEKNRIFNFGTRDMISVTELIELIIKISGVSVSIKRIADQRPDEILVQRVSWAKAKRILNWEPATDINKGLTQTIAWYREHIRIL